MARSISWFIWSSLEVIRAFTIPFLVRICLICLYEAPLPSRANRTTYSVKLHIYVAKIVLLLHSPIANLFLCTKKNSF